MKKKFNYFAALLLPLCTLDICNEGKQNDKVTEQNAPATAEEDGQNLKFAGHQE